MSNKLREFLEPELLPLFEDGEKLLSSVSTVPTMNVALPAGRQVYSDYSFVVFPFAKVYEGFLKKLFLAIGAISEYQYNNDRWRVGRALNPQLEKEFRHESVYDKLVQYCGGPLDSARGEYSGAHLADRLWQAWKRGRNQVFHFWPGRSKPMSLSEARDIIAELTDAMELALDECSIKY